MADLYEAKIEALYETLNRQEDRAEAVEIVRSLVASISFAA